MFKVLAGAAALFILSSILFVFAPALLKFDLSLWGHLTDFLLREAVMNSVLLIISVSLFSFFIGFSCAWVSCFDESPSVRWLSRILIIPLTIPAYMYAFIWRGYFEYGSSLEVFLRERCGLVLHEFAEVRDFLGLTLALGFSLFPYMFLLCRVGLRGLTGVTEELMLVLSPSLVNRWKQVYLPMLLPFVMSAVLLIAVEVMVDFGAAATFNVTTMSTLVYKSWIDLNSWQTACQLASVFFLSVIFLLYIKSLARLRHGQLVQSQPVSVSTKKSYLGNWSLGKVWLSGVVIVSVFFPVGTLLEWALSHWDHQVWTYVQNTLLLAAGSTFLVLSVALLLVWQIHDLRHRNRKRSWWNRGFVSLLQSTQVGYSVPGVVLGVSLLLVLHFFEASIDSMVFGLSVVVLAIGYLNRFLAIAMQSLMGTLERWAYQYLEVSLVYVSSYRERFFKVIYPMMRGGVGVSMILVFVEIVKELPMTLLLRPLGWDTLAVRLYQFTSEGQYEQAAPAALMIVVLGMVPMLWWLERLESRIVEGES